MLDAAAGTRASRWRCWARRWASRFSLAMPANVSPERKRILRAYGAQVEWTDPDKGSDGAILRARELAGNDPERFCYMDQYSNDANWLAHYRTTGPEIWEQTAGRVTHFVAGLGTSGTFMGTTRRLKELNPAIQAVSFQPDSPFHGLEGLKHMGTSMVPAIYNPHLADRESGGGDRGGLRDGAAAWRARRVCWLGSRRRRRWRRALRIAREEAAAGRAAMIVTVLPDSADKYLSERFWEEQ